MATDKTTSEKKPTCFVMMPISDCEGYDDGHFSRVYNHVLKPACENAGLTPFRADEVANTNYIIIDILRRIMDSDMVLCDLSVRNPNVMYELGIRQAFNKPVTLIKDDRTERVFDIQGLRYVEYDSNLRVDSVECESRKISAALTATLDSDGQDVNSIVQLLSVKPANLPANHELSQESSLILSAVNDLSSRMGRIESEVSKSRTILRREHAYLDDDALFVAKLPDGQVAKIGDVLYDNNGELGTIVNIHPDALFFSRSDGRHRKVRIDSSKMKELTLIPF